jgi:hypothetical protein
MFFTLINAPHSVSPMCHSAIFELGRIGLTNFSIFFQKQIERPFKSLNYRRNKRENHLLCKPSQCPRPLLFLPL